MSSRSGRNGANSTPAFMKLLRRIANSSPLMKDAANNSANKLHELYNEAQEIIDSQDVGIGDAHRFPPMSVTVNVGSFCNVTNALNIHCRTVGIPFFDEDWVLEYWVPMTRLCIPQGWAYTGFTDEGIKASLCVFLKVDVSRLSSDCKTEIVRVLGELLAIPNLNTPRANEVVNILLRTLFNEQADSLQSRATRRATANIILKSNIIVPFLTYLASQPLQNEKNNKKIMQGRDDLQADICYLVAITCSTLLGDMNSKALDTHGPAFKEAIDAVSPQIWTEISRLGNGLIYTMDHIKLNEVDATELRNRLCSIYVCFQCLVVLAKGTVDRKHMPTLQNFISRAQTYDIKIKSGEEGSDPRYAVLQSEWAFNTTLDIDKDARDTLAKQAFALSFSLEDLEAKSTLRLRSFLDPSVYRSAGGFSFDSKDKEKVEEHVRKAVEDQKRRSLLSEDGKPIRASGSGASLTGKRCAHCEVEEVAGSNLKLMQCGGCKSVWYCSAVCQKVHWPEHKKPCKAKQAENK